VRHRRGAWPRRWWAGALLSPLVIGRNYGAALLAAAASLAVLVFVVLVAVLTMGAAFARSAERRRACLQTLQMLLQAAPWTARRYASRPTVAPNSRHRDGNRR
jgi:hypothetical protein